MKKLKTLIVNKTCLYSTDDIKNNPNIPELIEVPIVDERDICFNLLPQPRPINCWRVLHPRGDEITIIPKPHKGAKVRNKKYVIFVKDKRHSRNMDGWPLGISGNIEVSVIRSIYQHSGKYFGSFSHLIEHSGKVFWISDSELNFDMGR